MKKLKAPKNFFYKLKDGYQWNPFRKLPRNAPCPCESGKKFKYCHLDKLPRTLDPNSLIPALEKIAEAEKDLKK